MAAEAWTRVGDDADRYDGYLHVVRRRLRLPDGRESDWDLLSSGDSVTVLPLTDDGAVVCVRQFRPGPDRVVTSLPGGMLETGEDVVAAARRELEEETGYLADSCQVAAPSQWYKSTEVQWSAVARGCTPTGRQSLDDLEDCDVVLLAVEDVRAELRAGRFGLAAQTYLALDHAGLL